MPKDQAKRFQSYYGKSGGGDSDNELSDLQRKELFQVLGDKRGPWKAFSEDVKLD